MVENKILYGKQEIKDILIKKESLIKVQPKGRMVVQKPRKIKTEREKLADALKRAYEKLRTERASSMKAKSRSPALDRNTVKNKLTVLFYFKTGLRIFYWNYKNGDGTFGPHESIGPRTFVGPH